MNQIVKLKSLKRKEAVRNFEINEVRKKMRQIPLGLISDEYIRIRYVRYADDFIVSVIGKHSLAVKILL